MPFTRTATDEAALDTLADLLKLPTWQIDGSGATFIECLADVVCKVRDTSGHASDELLDETGYDHDDYTS